MDEDGDEEEGKVTASNNTTVRTGVRIYYSSIKYIRTWHWYVRIDVKTMSLMYGNLQYYSVVYAYYNHQMTFIT